MCHGGGIDNWPFWNKSEYSHDLFSYNQNRVICLTKHFFLEFPNCATTFLDVYGVLEPHWGSFLPVTATQFCLFIGVKADMSSWYPRVGTEVPLRTLFTCSAPGSSPAFALWDPTVTFSYSYSSRNCTWQKKMNPAFRYPGVGARLSCLLLVTSESVSETMASIHRGEASLLQILEKRGTIKVCLIIHCFYSSSTDMPRAARGL